MKKLLINKKLVKETKIYIGNNSNDYLKNFISSKKLLIISSKSGRLRFLKKYPYLNITFGRGLAARRVVSSIMNLSLGFPRLTLSL